MAPERFENTFFLNLLRKIENTLIAFDEAHCISKWGHFRPSYQSKFLHTLKIRLLTATLGGAVQQDIMSLHQLDKMMLSNKLKGNLIFSQSDFQRQNLLWIMIES